MLTESFDAEGNRVFVFHEAFEGEIIAHAQYEVILLYVRRKKKKQRVYIVEKRFIEKPEKDNSVQNNPSGH